MPIKYYLVENNLTSDPDDYYARVEHVRSINEKEFIQFMLDENTGLDRSEIENVHILQKKVKKKLLNQGFRLNFSDESYETNISGVFNNKNDHFDRSRHKVYTSININTGLAGVYDNVRMEKVEEVIDRSAPFPQLFEDMLSETTNQQLSPGGIGHVKGHRLKVNPGVEEEGVFLVDADGEDTKVSILARNKPAELIFYIPEGLTSGDYTLEIRAHFKGSKTLRLGQLKETLTVL